MHVAAQGGSLDVIKYLLPMFRARVREKTNDSYTMLHWAAQRGHCQVARYLITELKLDPQDRDKVCGVPGDVLVSKCKVYMCALFSLCIEACCVMASESYPTLCLMVQHQ